MLYPQFVKYSLYLLLIAPFLASAEGQSSALEEIVVTGRSQVLAGEARSASEGVIGQMDLAIRPLLRPGDVLEAVPGLIVTQHSGSGKSNQMFLRGFNLDHGTDFATWVDGMPVNMRTHGHGQGYTDINFLIPETIERMDYVKGPYHAELGDFSSAGGVHIDTVERIATNRLTVGVGENGYQRLLAMGGMDLGDVHLSGALEGQGYDGPWTDIDENVRKRNGLLKLAGGDDSSRWSTTLMVYRNEWNSADQIPERAVRQNLIDELGSIDTTLGGDTQRISLSGKYSYAHQDYRSEWRAYVIDYELSLWSNFTYFLDDPTSGDQFRQEDSRRVYGGSYNRSVSAGDNDQMQHTFGVQWRYDDIENVGLYRTRARQQVDTVREDRVDQASVGLFYELAWELNDDWRALLGVRGDHQWFDVDAQEPANAGKDSDSIVSPKVSLIYAFSETSEAYLSGGYGFHSNDARGVTISLDPVTGGPVSPVDPLVQSRGGELGFKSLWLEGWNSSLAVWYLELESELLFVGDAGNTEASRPSERWGVEFNNFWAVSDIWSIEADFAWTDAQFSDNAPEGDEIPGALGWVASGAVSARYPGGWFGSIRLRHFDGAPLIEDGSVKADGSTMANLAVGWAGDVWRVQMDVLNALDSDDHDIDYFYASRLPGEAAEGVEDIHYHVFEPRQIRLYLSLNF
ncbi:outer membrane protein [Luminiphilus syltensis NOR5-1B]|uniref:Outer membrane protein n=1 Tax=Luminiphilus syltensis NOR5-1B TaxID=565045 RepID=B8KQV4_9GAMM|nr:TonB-dependent receptor [Luminiphilus syltensis]EED36598.1 outer membrane protein [Luminiphilus syltensis NOR5-1B]